MRALNKFSTDYDFSKKKFYMFFPTTNIRKSKIHVLMERSIDHCTIHKEGWNTNTRLRLREINIDNVFRGLNVTSQAEAQS